MVREQRIDGDWICVVFFCLVVVKGDDGRLGWGQDIGRQRG
jgi:hypothetical protein